MEWLLAKLISSFETIKELIQFSVEHPEAAAFWSGVTGVLLNFIVKFTPTKIDDSIVSAISRAIAAGVAKAINR